MTKEKEKETGEQEKSKIDMKIETKNCSEISWKFSQCLPQNTMDEESTKLKTVKVPIYPDKHQRLIFNKYADCHRYFKNKAIEEINKRYHDKIKEFSDCKTCIFCDKPKEKTKKDENKNNHSFTCIDHKSRKIPWKLNINLASIRASILKSNKIIKDEHPELLWQTEIPYDTRQLAIKETITDYKSAVSNRMRGNTTHFSMGYISRLKPSKNFFIDHRAINFTKTGVRMFPMKIKKEIYIQKSILRLLKFYDIKDYDSDTNVYCDRGKWYLMVTVPAEQETPKTKKYSGIVFDPGQRIPLAGAIPSKNIFLEIGVEKMKTIEKNKGLIDKLKSKRDLILNKKNNKKRKQVNTKNTKKGKKKCKKLKGINRKIKKLYLKNKGILSDFHNQTSSWVAKNNNVVLLPEFQTSDMQKKTELCSTVKGRLNSIGHYKLQQKIKYQCWKHQSEFYLVNENHTTRTCPRCGHWNEKFTGKTFDCKSCKLQGPRDFFSCINILIRTLTLHRTNKK